jgi:hypothetical protein
MSTDDTISAGDFSAWLEATRRSLEGAAEADVPCGPCTACCRSSQFVHIEPDERRALARIPSELLFPAPRLPAGHVLMGYDERGHCPMLVDDRCSIYEDRPRTCRTYDCRVFTAAGVAPDAAQPDIAARVQRWRFEHPTGGDRLDHEAVRAAARFVQERGARIPGGPPGSAVQVAVLAIRGHEAFVADGGGRVEPDVDAVADALRAGSAARADPAP